MSKVKTKMRMRDANWLSPERAPDALDRSAIEELMREVVSRESDPYELVSK